MKREGWYAIRDDNKAHSGPFASFERARAKAIRLSEGSWPVWYLVRVGSEGADINGEIFRVERGMIRTHRFGDENPPLRFRPGQRIVTTDYGQTRHGTVTRVGRGVIFVRLDGSQREVFKHPESLRPVGRGPTRNDGYGYGFDDDNDNPPRELTVPDQHRLRIARDTLRMSDAMARVMGGMTKEEARQVIRELTGRKPRENPRRAKPTRDDVDIRVWQERDRLHIDAQDKRTDQTIAEWWDDDAQQMFEDGFFYSPGPLGWRVGSEQRKFEASVIDYLKQMGLIQ